MDHLSISVKNNKYREAKTTRIAKAGHHCRIFILLAVIYQYSFVIVMQVFLQLRSGVYQLMKQDTPAAPVAANLYKYMLACFFCFRNCGIDVGLCIGLRVINFYSFFFFLRKCAGCNCQQGN
ncbi:hypothetical protein D3C87_1368990 [compost metagenome]